MKPPRCLGWLSIGLALAGCAGPRVESYVDPSAEFGGSRTYDWRERAAADDADTASTSRALNALAMAAVEKELAARGFQRATTRGAGQFVVDCALTLQGSVDVVSLGGQAQDNTARDRDDADRGAGHGPRWGWRYEQNQGWDWGEAAPETYERHHEEGALSVSVYDATSRRLVWRARTAADVDRAMPGETNARQLDEAARRVLRDFPPAAYSPSR